MVPKVFSLFCYWESSISLRVNVDHLRNWHFRDWFYAELCTHIWVFCWRVPVKGINCHHCMLARAEIQILEVALWTQAKLQLTILSVLPTLFDFSYNKCVPSNAEPAMYKKLFSGLVLFRIGLRNGFGDMTEFIRLQVLAHSVQSMYIIVHTRSPFDEYSQLICLLIRIE